MVHVKIKKKKKKTYLGFRWNKICKTPCSKKKICSKTIKRLTLIFRVFLVGHCSRT